MHLLTKNPIYYFKLANILSSNSYKNGIEIKVLKSSINKINSKNIEFNAF